MSGVAKKRKGDLGPVLRSASKEGSYYRGIVLGVRALIYKERLTLEEMIGQDVDGVSQEIIDNANAWYEAHNGRVGGVLLIRRAPDDSFNPGLWELPGGKMGDAPTIELALFREVLEETRLEVAPGREATFWDDASGAKKYKDCLYVCLVIRSYLKDYEEPVVLSPEHCGWRYVPLDPQYSAAAGCWMREETREALDRLYRNKILSGQADSELIVLQRTIEELWRENDKWKRRAKRWKKRCRRR